MTVPDFVGLSDARKTMNEASDPARTKSPGHFSAEDVEYLQRAMREAPQTEVGA